MSFLRRLACFVLDHDYESMVYRDRCRRCGAEVYG